METKKYQAPNLPGIFKFKGVRCESFTRPDILSRLPNFKFKPDDIVVASFTRSGTTVTQELIWHIKNKNIIEKGGKYGKMDDRFPCIEHISNNPDDRIDRIDILLVRANKQRLIKTHCQLNFFNSNQNGNSLHDSNKGKENSKTVIVIRNPRDTCVSCFHFYNVEFKETKEYFPGTFENFANLFVRGKIPVGSWIDFYLPWWKLAKYPTQHANLYFLKYEDIVTNIKQEAINLAKFLEENLTEEQLGVIEHNCSFSSMSQDCKDKAVYMEAASFFRKGQVGDWKNYFTSELIELFERELESKMLAEGLEFSFE